nr:DUF4135 domain-containing protein [Rhodococcus kroppenstedtii]
MRLSTTPPPDPVATVVDDAVRRVRCAAHRLPRGELVHPAAITAAVDRFAQDAEDLLGRTVAQEFHLFRTERDAPADPASTTALAAFDAHLRAGGVDRLWRTYPVAARRLDRLAADRLDQLTTILTALAVDAPRLHALGLLPPGPVTAIDIAHGDPHDGGRRVATLTVDDAASPSLVVKPRSADPDDLLGRIVALLDADTAGDHLRLPRCMAASTGDLSWHEFVSATTLPDDADADAARFHRRAGRMLAVFTALGSTDGHAENVVAAGDHPVPVDVETLLHPATENPATADPLTCALADGPLGTTMLPTGSPSSSMAALSRAGTRTPGGADAHRHVHRGTDAWTVAAVPATVTATAHRPTAPGTSVPVPLADHVDDVVTGFHTAVRDLARRRDEIHRLLDDARATTCRRVVRPTAVYTAFLDAARHPRYLTDAAEAERLFRLLPESATGTAAVTEAEIAALLRGDVPRFADRVDAPPPVGPTPLARAHRCLETLIRTPPAALEHLVRSALAGVDTPSRPAPARTSETDLHASLQDPDPRSGLARIERRLAARTVRRDGTDTALGTLDALPGASPDADPVLTAGDRTLYHGGGTALLGAALARIRPTPARRRRLADAAAAVTRHAEDQVLDLREGVPAETGRAWCPFTGALGTVWLLRELAGSGDRAVGARARDAADRLLTTVLDTESATDRLDTAVGPDRLDTAVGPDRLDIVGGLAGGVVVLTEFGLADHPAVRSAADRLAAALHGGEIRERGLAHGVDGLAWALARVDGHAERARLVDLPDDATAGDSWGRGAAGSSWCRGAAGLALCHTEIALAAGDTPAAVAAAATVPEPLETDDSLCHGETGVVAILRRLALLLAPVAPDAAADLDEQADRRARELQDRIRRAGYATGHPGHVGVTTFMTGVAGIAFGRVLTESRSSVTDAVDLPDPIALRPSRVAREG